MNYCPDIAASLASAAFARASLAAAALFWSIEAAPPPSVLPSPVNAVLWLILHRKVPVIHLAIVKHETVPDFLFQHSATMPYTTTCLACAIRAVPLRV